MLGCMNNGSLLAAVDLGSNSVRLEIGRLDHGQIHRVESLRDPVRLGNGLDADRNLTPEAMQRGLDALARFAERLAGFEPAQVRAVATQTLREARNRDLFLARAGEVLGFPIEVIPGREEARLIYQGVARLLPQSPERRLVIDIGGRSTEFILGVGLDAGTMESYRIGSVAWSQRYFPDGVFSSAAFQTAEVAAKAILDEAAAQFNRSDWEVAYGASGTVRTVAAVLSAAGWPPGVITRDGLHWFRRCLIRAGRIDQLHIEGLKEDRRVMIAGGLCVLSAIFDLLRIDSMTAAQGALRQGVLYDMLGRDMPGTDVRARSVERMLNVYGVEPAQAQRVETVALSLLDQLARTGPQTLPAERLSRLQRDLAWAARLHEIGTRVSHADYHKHGAYLIVQSEMAGFAMPELQRLSLLVLGHRGKLRKLEVDFDNEGFALQLLALRLAVILCHARRSPEHEALHLRLGGLRTFELDVPALWAQAYPQSAHLLREEVEAWRKTSWSLVLHEEPIRRVERSDSALMDLTVPG
jgi:exopolyphosphatase / guanosine-5'-triphosphate,3'-diphosphate pyrophosphatase